MVLTFFLTFGDFLANFERLVLGCTSYGARPQARAVNLSLTKTKQWPFCESSFATSCSRCGDGALYRIERQAEEKINENIYRHKL